MVGLAFAGGGVRGSYQVGAYLALKKCHIKIDGFVGTSIGSFNAAMLCAGYEKELLEFWQNANIGEMMGFSEEYVKELNKLHKSTNIFTHLINNAKEIIVNKGFETKGLESVLKKYDLEQRVIMSKKDFGLVTVRAKDLKPLYRFKEDIPQGKIEEHIIASCYLPVFKMQKLIDDSYYLDGGFYDNAPVNMLLDKGYDKVYVIELSAIGVKRKVKDKKKVIEIKPSKDLKSILNTNVDDIRYNIKLGYYDTLKVIKKLDGYKYIFRSYNDWIYKWLIRKADKKVLKNIERLFHTENPKKLIIKSLEHIMKRENYEYTNVYNPIELIKEIKKSKHNYGIYRFIKQLKIF